MPKANAREQKFMADIARFINEYDLGVLYGSEFEGRTDFQLHHVTGRQSKHNKIAIGHWFIIPVPVELHDVHSNHPDNVTHFKKNFVKRFGSQCDIYDKLLSLMDRANDFDFNFELPDDDVFYAIMDTRK